MSRTAIVVGLGLLLLVLTNPSKRDLEEYAPVEYESAREKRVYRRTANYLIFSFWEVDILRRRGEIYSLRYVGCLKNFFPLED